MPYLSESELAHRREGARRAGRRRRIAAALVAGVAAAAAITAIATGSGGTQHRDDRQPQRAVAAAAPAAPRHHPTTRLEPLRIIPARPGTAHVFLRGPATGEVALTFDDGFCASCVARIVHTLARTGAQATIFPNGRYSSSWDPVAPTIRRLVAAGQLTIGNHTFLHHDALEESADAFRADLENNEQWIERTFHVSSRPFFRPPYGAYDAQTLAVAGELGYTKVIMWSGTVADSSLHTIAYILAAIRYWARPGAIILMHGNYYPTSEALPQILEILHQRHLRPVTLQRLLG